LKNANEQVKQYLKSEFVKLLDQKYIDEWISVHLDYHEQRRVGFIVGSLSEFVQNEENNRTYRTFRHLIYRYFFRRTKWFTNYFSSFTNLFITSHPTGNIHLILHPQFFYPNCRLPSNFST